MQLVMKNKMECINTLHDLLDYDLPRFVNGEMHLKNILTSWIGSAGSLSLKTILQKYLELVSEHIQKMKEFLVEEAVNTQHLNNSIMAAIIEEADEKSSACSDPQVRDACILSSVQLINHFKICTYRTAVAFATRVGIQTYALIFREMENNEKEIDRRLTALAAQEINARANTPFSLESGHIS
jgi:ferritin-like metal-binding protein YciE